MTKAPTTPVLCTSCGRELRGSECADGFRVRRHRDTQAGRHCLDAIVERVAARAKETAR